jgi:hypothetical protein
MLTLLFFHHFIMTTALPRLLSRGQGEVDEDERINRYDDA